MKGLARRKFPTKNKMRNWTLFFLFLGVSIAYSKDCGETIGRLDSVKAAEKTQRLQEKLEASRHGEWVKSWRKQNGEKPRYKTTDKPGNPLGAGGENPPKDLTEAQIQEYAEKGFLVDIAQVTHPNELPQKIRQATRDSAEIAFRAAEGAEKAGVDAKDVLHDWAQVESGALSFPDFLKKYPSVSSGSSEIHQKWIENNSWLPETDPLRKPFSELPVEEQRKDTDFIIDAMKLSVEQEGR